MPYGKGVNLPSESASKLGHLSVIESKWVKSLVADFEAVHTLDADPSATAWLTFDPTGITPLRNIWAVDGSFVSVRSEQKPPKEVAFVKTALLMLDRAKLENIDKDLPHPLLLRDALKDSGVQHATVFPLRNVRTSMGSNYDAVRHIVRDSMRVDQGGAFYETLKWLAYKQWNSKSTSPSPGFQCPHCGQEITEGLPHGADERMCPHCAAEVFLSDVCGFHLEMDEDSAPDSVASSYMLVMEHLMLFTAVRLMWHHTDLSLVTETLFIKDGPLTLRSQYSKLVSNIREFLEHAKIVGRPVHIIGQEKSGAFFDHLASIARFAPPHDRGEPLRCAVLTHEFVRREVYRSPDLSNPYGFRTNWGEKIYIKVDPGTYMVINAPTGAYLPHNDRPIQSDIIGLARILATIPSLVSHKFEGALYPVELANGIASMSSYPSATILQRFLESQQR
ncbi:zinc ribbon domain-containing protein [Burkholderia multivorans]|uniref:zinc ribbon domain-containing protein n=1 Tax=Burkholderia multivorans TaxID=87883 RepID=UPI001C220671|nr:zinc ribbon domain-containing protein [Burkholderia multivorans]MBU9290533.1 zinc ribbon domain-containing protein [Burkholderia multivorans]